MCSLNTKHIKPRPFSKIKMLCSWATKHFYFFVRGFSRLFYNDMPKDIIMWPFLRILSYKDIELKDLDGY